MPAQLRRDVLIALSVKAALLTALLAALSLAIPRPVADEAATASAVLGGSQTLSTKSTNEALP
jgi:hypothetical protein